MPMLAHGLQHFCDQVLASGFQAQQTGQNTPSLILTPHFAVCETVVKAPGLSGQEQPCALRRRQLCQSTWVQIKLAYDFKSN
mmetsp:Transcript_52846/g.115304  ORF Transcript_52846/g.115304 Transcript_52846/m.115304 type:complete len:82 (-) Transcript_52846:124-369(-)